jgi:hypothetical protein
MYLKAVLMSKKTWLSSRRVIKVAVKKLNLKYLGTEGVVKKVKPQIFGDRGSKEECSKLFYIFDSL